MKYRLFSIALSAVVLALCAGTSIAADTHAPAPTAAASKAAPTQAKAKAPAASASEASAKLAKAAQRRKAMEAKRKAAAKIKLVDVNSASSQELMSLPGISEADAGKIIAARPYGSKTWLMTHKVLPAEQYQAISGLIVVKNAAKNTAKSTAKNTTKK
jgi:exonuclease VII large subunit